MSVVSADIDKINSLEFLQFQSKISTEKLTRKLLVTGKG